MNSEGGDMRFTEFDALHKVLANSKGMRATQGNRFAAILLNIVRQTNDVSRRGAGGNVRIPKNADFPGQDVAWTGTDDGEEFLWQIVRRVSLSHKSALSDPVRPDEKMAALLGFEPRQSDSESLVLPLHHKAKEGGRK